ncbi:MAG TPA: hypothetical protein VN922_05355, partial [Bacteroidia bacterium]|nr:hypothetical protein [Bacteroidia bacterium]
LDFIGADSIKHRMQKLKFLQDTLARLNKTLLLVFAASKGTYYPEYFPDKYTDTKKGITNYQVYLKDANEMGINHIDFNKYFVDNKNKAKYTLFTKYGIHWSFYGECLAADSMIKYIEAQRKITMPHIYWHDINMNYPQVRDADVEDGMNLLYSLKSDKLAYPFILFQSDSGKTKPSSIIIADSFYWGMFGFGISKVFSDSHFWFYNNAIYPENYTSGLNTSQVNLKEQINKTDVIVIMATDVTLPKLGWGFIEDAYNIFKGTSTKLLYGSPEYNAKIKEIVAGIKANAPYLKEVEDGAEKRGISLDSALILNAIWVIDHPN